MEAIMHVFLLFVMSGIFSYDKMFDFFYLLMYKIKIVNYYGIVWTIIYCFF